MYAITNLEHYFHITQVAVQEVASETLGGACKEDIRDKPYVVPIQMYTRITLIKKSKGFHNK